MAANTLLMDFSIDPTRILDEVSRKDILKVIRENLEKYFNQLKISYDFTTEDSYLCILTDKTGVVTTVRFYLSKGLITINLDYYKDDVADPKITFEVCHLLNSHFCGIIFMFFRK